MGAERTGIREVLAWGPLGGVTLPIAHAHIVVAGVSRNMRADILFGDVTPPAADHNRKLSLVIEGSREAWPQYWGSMPDLRVGKSRENRWILVSGRFVSVRWLT